MKVKDLERTANIAWSPQNVNPIYLAAGTAAQQLDASFSTNAALEIFSLNLTEPGMEMESKLNVASEHRFHKIVWGPHAGDGYGTIVGGCDDGIVQIYNAGKLLKNEDGLVCKKDKHSGSVHSLDFNPFQSNLLATGAAESEIYIWDMNNTTTPMTPGAKSQPFEDVLSIQWNRQVQHILASTFSSKCVVWDLRKNEPIIKLTDTVSRIRWKVVAWHPEVATQLCLASEEDQAPIIQLWDLRFATSPLKTLENHQRGVLSIAWCSQDPDLLVSCGKDNRIVCWNPNSNNPGGEILSEVAKTNQWNFDITWCPKNPALIATPGFDGHVSVYSLMGGKAQQIQTTNKIADSFPGMEGYVQAPVAQQNVAPISVDLSKPPKWLKKPCGASFGFGGKLFTYDHDKSAISQALQNAQPGEIPPHIPRTVSQFQVITEADLVEKSTQLEQALEYGNFTDYCKNKADLTNDQHKKYVWHFLKANFEPNPRTELLNLLGYKIEDVNSKLGEYVDFSSKNEIDTVTEQMQNINRLDDFNLIQNSYPETPEPVVEPFKILTGDDTEGLIAQALLLNNVEAAVELCLKAKRFADAILIAMTGGEELLARTQHKYLQQCTGYVSSLISALLCEDWASVINKCDINSWKEALAAALTHATDEDLPGLCELMGSRLQSESQSDAKLLQDAQLCYICAGSFEKLVSSWTKNASNSNEDLQELVELVTFVQKSVERQGRQVQIDGNLAELLTRYAYILASQGSLNIALNYLGTSQNEQVNALRERLYIALGQKPAYGQMQPRTRQNTARSSIGGYTNPFNPPANTYNQFESDLMGNTRTPAWQPLIPQQPVKPFSPPIVAPTAASLIPAVSSMQPPRPGSVGSGQASGLPKNKYVVDPSVQSNSYGARNAYQPPIATIQPQNFQTNAFANAPINSYNPYPPAPVNPIPSNPSMFTPSPFASNTSFPPPSTANSYNPAPFVPESVQQATDMAQPAMNLAVSSATPGWNDPPVYNKTSKPTPIRSVAPMQDPITHPIFGAQGPTNGYVNQPFNPYEQQSNFQGPPPPTGPYNAGFAQQQQQQQQNNFNAEPIQPMGFNAQAVNRNVTQVSQPMPVEKVQTPVPIEKAPIPEEHIHMQTVFNELRYQCSCAANNPQTKRKIDDVAKKLETLYDLLRERKLSPNTLSSLHQMVQLIQNGDFTGGLNLHTQLVSGPDFSQIASFMPGLKVLLQCALQLQVYLR